MAEENVQVKFGAAFDELIRGLSNMTGQFRSSIDGMKGQLASLQEVGAGVQRVFLGVTAVLAGGAVFTNAVRETERFIFSNIELARRLGISAEEAGSLNVALGDAFVDTGKFEQAQAMLARQLSTNEERFRALGVSTRDQNGNFRNAVDLMLDVNKRLLEFREGTDRNIEGIKIYGRSWMEIQDVLKVTPQSIEAARQKMEALGLTITQQGVQSTMAYKSALNDVGDVGLALKNVIGQALMPILANLGNWFAETGPTLVSAFRVAIAAIVSLLWGLVFAAQAVREVLSGAFENIRTALSRLMSAFVLILKGDFTGAKDEIVAGFVDIMDQGQLTFDRIVERARAASKAIMDLWDPDLTPASQGKGGGGTSAGEDVAAKSRVSSWQTQWEVIKAAQGNALRDMLDAEKSFWTNILRREQLSVEERVQVYVKLGNIRQQVQKRGIDSAMIELEREVVAEKDATTRQVLLAEKKLALIENVYGRYSLEYKRAQMEMDQAHQARINAAIQRELQGMSAQANIANRRLEIDRQHLRNQETAGQITAQQRLQLEFNLEQEIFNNKLAVLKSREAHLSATQIAERQALHAEIEALEVEHMGRSQQLNFEMHQANVRFWQDLFSPIQNAISTTTQGLILGTTTWRKALENFGVSMLASFIDWLSKMLFQWLATQLAMTGATAAGAATRSGIEAGAAAKSVALWAATALKNIANAAWEAAAGAYKAIVGIPFIGPFLAPIAALTAAAAVGSFAKNIVSAEGGYDVPAETMAKLHPREMVLPSNIADPLRTMITSGGIDARPLKVEIHAVDARGIERLLIQNPTAVRRGVENMVRNLGIVNVRT